MSTFNPGSGGSLVSTTLPGAMAELALNLHNAEQAISEAERPTSVTITSDFDSQSLIVTASMPITQQSDASGNIVLVARDYLGQLSASGGNGTFNNGGGQLQATNKAAAFLELANLLSAAELAVPEDTRPNNVAMSADLEGLTADITITIPVTYVKDATGKIVMTAVDYI